MESGVGYKVAISTLLSRRFASAFRVKVRLIEGAETWQKNYRYSRIWLTSARGETKHDSWDLPSASMAPMEPR